MIKIFKRKNKTNNKKEFNLLELINIKEKLVEAGKLNADYLLNTDLSKDLEDFIYEKLEWSYKIQKDIEIVKKAITLANYKTSNFINIYKYENSKTMLQVLNKLEKNKKNENFFKKIKLNQKKKRLKIEMVRLSRKMKAINEGYKVELELISGVIK